MYATIASYPSRKKHHVEHDSQFPGKDKNSNSVQYGSQLCDPCLFGNQRHVPSYLGISKTAVKCHLE